MLMLRKPFQKKYQRSIIIIKYPEGDKFINNDVLKVGYQAKSKPYAGEPRPNLIMDDKDLWLDHIEESMRGVNHTSY